MTRWQPRTAILVPGRNCWRLEPARRVAFLIDGQAYFTAVRAAAVRAQRSIFIIGWDIDSRTRLVPEGAGDGRPEPLLELLNALAARRSGLHVHVLDWDFAMLYATERELLPAYKLGWRAHHRLHFQLDGTHPVGASHHQKVVVIDDRMAFVGGFDLTNCRWDTPAHAPDDPHRRHPRGGACPPFHDVQMAVDGPVAAALGELARERWRRATGKTLEATDPGFETDPWPPDLEPDLRDSRVAIARTEPEYQANPGLQEIKQLYLDAIAAGRDSLYFENQFFSAGAIAEALAARLTAAEGPDIALISRLRDEGWLEATTMGVLRARLYQRLQCVDAQHRFASFYPHVPGLEPGFLNVHAKLFIMDDELVTIGSANLSNRSLGLDTECNLAIEAHGDARVRQAIRGLRHRLLGEHLDVPPEAVAEAHAKAGRLLAGIASLRGRARTLRPLQPELSEDLDAWVPDSRLIDPEQPVEPEELVAQWVPVEARVALASRVFAVAVLAVVVLSLAVAGQGLRVEPWPDLQGLFQAIERLVQAPVTPLAVLGLYMIAGLLFVPVIVLIGVSIVLFGAWPGLAYAWVGALLSAAASYGLGRALGRRRVRHLVGGRLDRLSRRLAQRGMWSWVMVRLLPVLPFSVVNLVAGALRVDLRHFLISTGLGMTPGILAIAIFIDRIVAAIRDPGWGAGLLLATLVALMAAAMLVLRRKATAAGAS